jgi:hypothetical protein
MEVDPGAMGDKSMAPEFFAVVELIQPSCRIFIDLPMTSWMGEL